MKLKYFPLLILGTIGLASIASAVSIIPGQQGGTGISTTTIGNIGNCLRVSSVNPLIYTFGTCAGGSSSFTTTTIAGLTATTFNVFSTSTPGISTSSPNNIYIGPDQVYYLASNPNGYITSTSTVFQPNLNGAYVSSFNGATGTVTYSAPNSATTTINTVAGPTFIFSVGAGLSLASSSNQFTWTNTGLLSNIGNWAGTWNGVASSTFYLASNPSAFITATSTAFYPNGTIIPYASTTGVQASLNGAYVSSTVAGSNITVSAATGSVTIAVTSTPSFTTVNGITLTSTAGMASSTWLKVANNLSDLNSTTTAGTNLGLGSAAYQASSTFLTKATNFKSIQWTEADATSTNVYDTPMFTFQTTSTIQKIYVSGRDATGTIDWNLYYATDPTATQGNSFKVLAANRTTTSTPGSAQLITSFASSTPGLGQTMRIATLNASTTAINLTIWYTEN